MKKIPGLQNKKKTWNLQNKNNRSAKQEKEATDSY